MAKFGRVSRVALAGCLSLVSFSQGQAPASIWDGVYSTAQAGKGKADYQMYCASCHGDKLEGRGQTPPLEGSDFTSRWDGMNLADLFEKMQSSMPADRPGQLSKEQNAAILSYLLQANQMPAGSVALASEAAELKGIQFAEKKPSK